MEKVVDHQRRGREGAADGVVVAHVGQALGGGEGADLLVQRRPVTAVAAGVDGLVEGRERGIARGDVVEDGLFVAAAQVEVLQPDEVAVVFGAADDGGHVGDAGKDGRDEAGGAHAGLVEGAHGLEAARDGRGIVHVAAEALIQRVDRPGDAGVGEGADEVEVAQHEVGLGGICSPRSRCPASAQAARACGHSAPPRAGRGR